MSEHEGVGLVRARILKKYGKRLTLSSQDEMSAILLSPLGSGYSEDSAKEDLVLLLHLLDRLTALSITGSILSSSRLVP